MLCLFATLLLNFADSVEDAAWPLELVRKAVDELGWSAGAASIHGRRDQLRALFAVPMPAAYLRRLQLFDLPAGLCVFVC
jgi:hypothetical protein